MSLTNTCSPNWARIALEAPICTQMEQLPTKSDMAEHVSSSFALDFLLGPVLIAPCMFGPSLMASKARVLPVVEPTPVRIQHLESLTSHKLWPLLLLRSGAPKPPVAQGPQSGEVYFRLVATSFISLTQPAASHIHSGSSSACFQINVTTISPTRVGTRALQHLTCFSLNNISLCHNAVTRAQS